MSIVQRQSQTPNPQSRLFILVAGEVSGDLLGGDLILALRERFPNATFAGIGGPRMIDAGFDAWYPAEKLAVMGLVEVLKHLPELLSIRRDVKRRVLTSRPSVFIGIDAPDFNLGLEKVLKRAGIPTVHYVSPSVWAWREKRVEKIGRSADRVLCLFPMEPAIYARHGVDARFVGHPLADRFPLEPDRAAARAALGIPIGAPMLALLPGSRLGEIARLGTDFAGAAKVLAERIPGLRIVAPMANEACARAFASVLGNAGFGIRDLRMEKSGSAPNVAFPIADSRFPILISGNAQTAMIAADAVLLASGTAALEAMLAKRPMVVAYRLAPMTYRIVKALGLLKVKHYALPNVLAEHALVPEILQNACNPESLAAALLPMFGNRDEETPLIEEFRRLHRLLRRDASHSAAAAIAELAG